MEHYDPRDPADRRFIANGSEPWRIPAMKDYPAITPPDRGRGPRRPVSCPTCATKTWPAAWAFPGKTGLEHRVGGLEKDCVKGCISHDPSNHQKMVRTRAEKVAKAVDDIPGTGRMGRPGRRPAGSRLGRYARTPAKRRRPDARPGEERFAVPFQLHQRCRTAYARYSRNSARSSSAS